MVSAIPQDESTMVHICSLPLKPPSHLSPHPTFLGCHRAPALGFLHHTANSHWLSTAYMVIYTFQCYCLKSSHLLPPPLCPEVCSVSVAAL